ncbi:MAG: T9SS type A sorting domain-containing protein [Rhizobacter sp.]|nr:T9SS type A sorting domain-containing protein [Chlorobiales bacterium]
MINGTYQKFGIYAWDPSNYTPNERRTIWFDNVAYITGNPTDAFERLQVPALAAASAAGKRPTTFALSQNYPNPFNPATAIDYQLSVGSEVKLKVFDVLGREVATLVSATQAAGNYSVNFDAKNLTSGVYFYRLQAGNVTETKKLLLLK